MTEESATQQKSKMRKKEGVQAAPAEDPTAPRGVSTRFGLFAVGNSTGQALTYALPAELADTLKPGTLCEVPVRGSRKVALYLEPCEKPTFPCQPVLGLLAHTVPLPAPLLALVRWVGRYYLAPEGRAGTLAAPGFVWNAGKSEARAKRFGRIVEKQGQLNLQSGIRGEREPRAFGEGVTFVLSEAQEVAKTAILDATPPVTCLCGVTGSGKTEVYLSAAASVLKGGRTVLVLVPEIALTPQMSGRFRKVFGDLLAILHSGLTAVEYEREWFRVLHGQARVVLGVRSAVFAPLANIGLIVVDEEHDQSYKTDEFPCYNARDVAVKRAALEHAACVLGSATPSLETWANAKAGRYGLARLEARFQEGALEVDIIDARLYFPNASKRGAKRGAHASAVRSGSGFDGGERGVPAVREDEGGRASSLVAFAGKSVTPPVFDALAAAKARGEQAMIIVNRRGYANYALCRGCGESLRCPHCSVTTTLHDFGRTELCHYCGFTRPALPSCPKCGSVDLEKMGTGTQNIEAEIREVLRDFRLARLDRDVLTSNTRLTGLLADFREGRLDGLVGTQILSKGHDFPKVSLVVMLHVEDALLLPDFRSSERTYQLVAQSAGRAGRAGLPGKVLVQSLSPQLQVVHEA
ncbi:MAG: primosomal protein N', partial [Silvanigrellales bacterium]|nr:primosomal protein N' [Silvanigrellales bacterium]